MNQEGAKECTVRAQHSSSACQGSSFSPTLRLAAFRIDSASNLQCRPTEPDVLVVVEIHCATSTWCSPRLSASGTGRDATLSLCLYPPPPLSLAPPGIDTQWHTWRHLVQYHSLAWAELGIAQENFRRGGRRQCEVWQKKGPGWLKQ